jgi:TonB-dependent SusC/RagA subfamily outer membrane receptor
MKVTVRGLGTVGKSGPLYIIDGVEGDITAVSPSDIESIDVLKDAASAAIYGAQSANGVVLVTTKSGKEGKAQVTFDAYYGIQNVARKADMLNAREYMSIMNEQALNSGSSAYDFSKTARPGIYNADGTVIDTDWIDQMFKDNAKTQSYSLGINGGSATSNYSISLGYLSQEGIVGGEDVSNYERYNFRINTEHKLYKDVLKVGQHASFVYVKNTGIGVGNQYNNTLRGAFSTSPLSPVYSDNNKYDSPYNDTTNSDGLMWTVTLTAL